MEDTIHLDVETRSKAPFGKTKGAVTAYQYARDPSTQCLLFRYAIGDGPVLGWRRNTPLPADLIAAVKRGAIVAAHNAGFEYEIWNQILVPQYGAPPLPFHQMDCTAVRASVMALPRSLGEACKAMGMEIQKDDEGYKVMMKMAKPRKHRRDEDPDSTWWHDTPELFERLYDYCGIDVEAERGLDKVLKPLSDTERRMWHMDHKTNQHGVKIDIEFSKKAMKVMACVERRYSLELSQLTGGKVTSVTQVAEIKDWLEDQGVDTDSLAKGSVIELRDRKLPAHVDRVLEIRQEAGKSSVAKYIRFVQLTFRDGYMRDNFMHHHANTGRAGGKGAQLQNLPSRGGLKWYIANQVMDIILETKDPEWAVDRIEMLFGHIPEALSSCLRGCIVAPAGRKLFVADFSNIEGRVAAWLGGEKKKLDAFRLYDTFLYDAHGHKIPDGEGDFLRAGPDLYKVTAASILGLTPELISKVQRNIMGKVPELALGFGGGVGAFISMGANYNVHMADYWDIVRDALDPRFIEKAYENWDTFGSKSGIDQIEWLASEAIKLGWRSRHQGIVRCWRDAEDAAKAALNKPGKWFKFAGGKCALGAQKIGGKMFLLSRLPNGRILYRCDASLKEVRKFGKVAQEIRFYGVDATTRQWVRKSTYGGDIFQSFVQGIARDVMMNGWENVEKIGFDVNLQVHDEIGAEGDEDRSLEEFCAAMTDLPAIYDGLPVSAAGYVADRYRKD